MHGVIMAGGRGTRLQPLTDHRPKPMVPLLGRPVIDYVKDAMLDAGVSELVVTTGYRGDDLATHVSSWSEDGVHARVNRESTPMGTAGSVRLLADVLTSTFIVGSGDGVSTLDVSALLAHHRATGAALTIGLVEVEDPSSFGIVGLGATNDADVDGDLRGGYVRRFAEKPALKDAFSRLINAGVYIVEPEALAMVPAGVKYDFSRDLFPSMLEAGLPIAGLMLDGLWFDIGEPHHLLEAQATLLGGPQAFLHDGAMVEDGASVHASLLMDDATVATECTVDSTILGVGVTVGKGAVLKRCVIGDGAVVQPGERLFDVRRAA
ncbi:MAG: sugar phosphate nucleotidyltransferase [Candidatus Poseidoniaceae archaeon]